MNPHVRAGHPEAKEPLFARSFWGEGWLVYIVSCVLFFLTGYYAVVQKHVISFQVLDQVTRALTVWHNDPSKLAALGFDYPPLTTILYLPFGLWNQAVSSLVIIPLVAALVGGCLIVCINHLLRFASLPFWIRYPLLAFILISPLTLFYAGMSIITIMGVTTMLTSLAYFAYWVQRHDLRLIVISSLWAMIACLSSTTNIAWVIILACAATYTLVQRQASKHEVEGTLIAFWTPILFGLGIWTFFNWVIIQEPFHWFMATRDLLGQPHLGTHHLGGTFLHWLTTTNWLVFLVIPVLTAISVGKKDPLPKIMLALCLTGLLLPLALALISQDSAWLDLRSAFMLNAVSILGLAIVCKTAPEWKLAGILGATLLLIGSSIFTWHTIQDYSVQNLEGAFTKTVLEHKDQEGKTTRNGQVIGVREEYGMGRYIHNHITKSNSILTDDSQTFGVIGLSGEARLFYGRTGHDNWKSEITRPHQKIQYVLLAKNNTSDMVQQAYTSTRLDTLQVVYQNARYALYERTTNS